MAEVLSVPRRPDGQSYYSSPNLKRSSPSRSSFLSGSPSYSSSRTTPTGQFDIQHNEHITHSLPSSAPTSARQSFTDLSQQPSFSSTPASSISFGSNLDDDEGIAFPSYDDVQFFHTDEPLDLPSSPKEEVDSDSHDLSSTTDTTRSDSPLPTPTVSDDTALKHEPSRHVDYLSHNWREEDIWSSWRHIVSQRRVYGQRSRLENASWRTWAKSKYQLATVSPEALNWLKESDVTWLYGPLQPATSHPVTQNMSDPPSQLSNSHPFVTKKPILKKRSMSEVMLQRSISASSLLKQAAASVQAQQSIQPQRPRPSVVRRASDFVPSNAISNPISRDQMDYFSSRTSSDSDTPSDCPSKRHIRFDDKVEQCIAVECKDADFDDETDMDERHHDHDSDSESDSSEDGVVMMRRPRRKRPVVLRNPSSKSNAPSGKTIEKLPDTTLKYLVDSPEVTQQPPTPFTRSWSSSKLSPSPSQETLRPSHPSRNYLLADDDDEDEVDMDWTPSGAYSNRRDSVAVTKARTELSTRDDDDGESSSGLRRTPSGMFMPYEEDEDDIMAEQLGLIGKVNETINTAKDIAHVIWNVGWRK